MIDQIIIQQVKHTAQLISNARYVVVFTGAGISTSSGIPDFRSERKGLWQRYDPMQVASLTAFHHTPDIFYDWFRPLFQSSYHAQPNAAHLGLAKLEQSHIIRSVITQNIDTLHQKSGSQKVIELHGSALTFTCPVCGVITSAEQVFNSFSSGKSIPLCLKCEKILKPDIILFEEPLPMDAWQIAEIETRKADLMLVIGSSLEVYPASTIPYSAAQKGSRIIINNLSPTPLDKQADVVIPLDAAQFVPLLVDFVNQEIKENS